MKQCFQIGVIASFVFTSCDLLSPPGFLLPPAQVGQPICLLALLFQKILIRLSSPNDADLLLCILPRVDGGLPNIWIVSADLSNHQPTAGSNLIAEEVAEDRWCNLWPGQKERKHVVSSAAEYLAVFTWRADGGITWETMPMVETSTQNIYIYRFMHCCCTLIVCHSLTEIALQPVMGRKPKPTR